jgi:hypothetical protein
VRSVAAVLAGFITLSVAIYAMQGAGTAILRQMNPDLPATASIVNHSTGTRVFWLIWETASMMAAGYVTARLAATSHVVHAVVMGAIQAVVTAWAMVSMGSEEPMWFWLTGIALMIPAAWLGGWLRVKRSASVREPSP